MLVQAQHLFKGLTANLPSTGKWYFEYKVTRGSLDVLVANQGKTIANQSDGGECSRKVNGI